MNILLIQQDMGRRARAKAVYPLGLVAVAQHIPPYHNVKIFDPNLIDYPLSLECLIKEINSFQPDVIGLSIKYIDTTIRLDPFIFYNAVPEMISVIKKSVPHIRIVVGGAGFSLFPREIMTDISDIDFGIFLEGEESFAELLSNLDNPAQVKGIFYRAQGSIQYTGSRPLPPFIRPLDLTRIPRFIYVPPYITSDYQCFGIQTKRGCTFLCIYCNYPFLNGKEIRFREVHDVVDEIEFFYNKFGLKTFSFADNIFNVPRFHAEGICREIIARGLNVEWGAWCDLANLSESFIDLAQEAGCRAMDFSPDASTQQGLDCLGKKISLQDLKKGIQLARKKKAITFAFNFFCSHPRMSLVEIIKTLFLWLTIPLLLWERGRVGLGWIRIYPNTPIYQVAITEGIISENTVLLAKTPEALSKLFYCKKSWWLFDSLFLSVIRGAGVLIKPLLRALEKFRGRKYPFYYD